MIDRRTMIAGTLAALAFPGAADAQLFGTHGAGRYEPRARTRTGRDTVWGRMFSGGLDPKYRPQNVRFTGYPPGTIVINVRKRFLYYVMRPGLARRYGVGVGRAGLAWSGRATVGRKAKWPRWTPTPAMIRREPHKYARWAGGMRGGRGNPLGARALYLYRGNRDTLYRIHGTNEPQTIGRAVSSGCIRMVNEHVEELYEMVKIGTPVVVL